MSTEVRRPVQIAVRTALRQATFRRRVARRRRGSAAATAQDGPQLGADNLVGQDEASKGGFAPGEKGTLELGSLIVLGTVGLGLGFGRWPAWTVLVAAGGYVVWVVSYSEATVQVRRRWPSADRPAHRTSLPSPVSAPPEE